jgi:hypothetical protein
VTTSTFGFANAEYQSFEIKSRLQPGLNVGSSAAAASGSGNDASIRVFVYSLMRAVIAFATLPLPRNARDRNS